MWCFISCLDSHSDGTHSLQRIHCWARDVMLNSLQICSEAQGKPISSLVYFTYRLPEMWRVKLRGGFRTPGGRRVCRSFLSGGGVCWSLCRTLCSCLQSTLVWVNLHAPQNTDYCKHSGANTQPPTCNHKKNRKNKSTSTLGDFFQLMRLHVLTGELIENVLGALERKHFHFYNTKHSVTCFSVFQCKHSLHWHVWGT